MRIACFLYLVLSACMPSLDRPPPTVMVGECGDGTWRFGSFEIHHIDIGRGVATLIVSPTGETALIDLGETAWDRTDGAERVGAYVRKTLGCARIDTAVVSHFHVDHAGMPFQGGLWHLTQVQGFQVGRLVHRDLAAYAGTSAAMRGAWQAFLSSPEGQSLHPQVARMGVHAVDLGVSVASAIVAVDGSGALPPGDFSGDPSPPDENDYSIALLVRFGSLDYLTAGDLPGAFAAQAGYAYHDLETGLARIVKDVDVYRVSHHGSRHSSNPTLVGQLSPRVSILQVGDDNTDGHPSQEVVDRARAVSRLYLTQHGDPGTNVGDGKVLGDVVVRSRDGRHYSVGDDVFTATDPVRADGDGDGFYAGVDPDDTDPLVVPLPRGGCDSSYQGCL